MDGTQLLQRAMVLYVFWARKLFQQVEKIDGKFLENGFDYSLGELKDKNFLISQDRPQVNFLFKKDLNIPFFVLSRSDIKFYHLIENRRTESSYLPTIKPIAEILNGINGINLNEKRELLNIDEGSRKSYFPNRKLDMDIKVENNGKCSIAVMKAITYLPYLNYFIQEWRGIDKYKRVINHMEGIKSENHKIEQFEKLFPLQPTEDCNLREYLRYVLSELANSLSFQWFKVDELDNPYVQAIYNNKIPYNLIDQLFGIVVEKEFLRILDLKNVKNGRNTLDNMIKQTKLKIIYFPFYVILSREDIGVEIEDIPLQGFTLGNQGKYRLCVIIIKKEDCNRYYGYYFQLGYWHLRVDNTRVNYPDLKTMMSHFSKYNDLKKYPEEFQKNKVLMIYERETF